MSTQNKTILPIPEHPDSRNFRWLDIEVNCIQEYGCKCFEACKRAAIAQPAQHAQKLAAAFNNSLESKDNPGNISAAARAAGVPRTTYRWRLAAAEAATAQAKHTQELAGLTKAIQKIEQQHADLVRKVQSLSEDLRIKIDKDDLRIAVADVNRTIDFVAAKIPRTY